MKNFSLDSVLLFVLVIPFIMNFRISPSETPYWLFGLIFVSLLIYIILDLLKISEKFYFNLKQILFWIITIQVIGSAFISAIIVRHQTAPVYNVHDIVIQQEVAIRYLIHGKNPYSTTYFGTPLEEWHYSDKETNPALYHFVMQPFYLLFAIPFYFISTRTIGYFDGRMPLLFLILALLILASTLIRDKKRRLEFLILLAFNPAMLSYNLEGRSDLFMFPFLFAALYFLYRKKYLIAGIPMALAFAVKQSVWPIFPFYFAYIYFKTRSLTKTIKLIAPFFLTFLTIVLPFFLWNTKAFMDSTIYYLSGKTEHSYPISGYGFGKLLNQLGFIKDVHKYYPFEIWQLLIGLPLMIILLVFLKKQPNIKRLIIVYGIFLFVYWYFSRYFNNSHLAYLSVIFLTSYYWPEETENQKNYKK